MLAHIYSQEWKLCDVATKFKANFGAKKVKWKGMKMSNACFHNDILHRRSALFCLCSLFIKSSGKQDSKYNNYSKSTFEQWVKPCGSAEIIKRMCCVFLQNNVSCALAMHENCIWRQFSGSGWTLLSILPLRHSVFKWTNEQTRKSNVPPALLLVQCCHC